MDKSTRNAAIGAAIVLAVFALLTYMLPAITLWLGRLSPIAAGAFVILFLVGPFIVLWLRGWSQRRRDN